MIFDKLFLKRGTKAKCDAYSGSEGEVVFDKEQEAIRVFTKNTLKSGGKVVANVADVPKIASDNGFITKQEVNNLIEQKLMTLDKIYPIGSIFFNLNDIDPASILGGGTWEKLDEGRVLIGANSKYVAGTVGGEEKHKITIDEMASHVHEASAKSAGDHEHKPGDLNLVGQVGVDGYIDDEPDHTFGVFSRVTYSGNRMGGSTHDSTTRHGFRFEAKNNWTGETDTSGDHDHVVEMDSVGGDTAMSLMQPYLAVHMWKRVA